MKYLLVLLFCFSFPLYAQEGYSRAVETPDNVKNKFYPKTGKIELNLPDVGMIFNQALLTTFLVHGGITYYTSEEWGFGAEFSMGMNQQKSARDCLETFYNDPTSIIGPECNVLDTADEIGTEGAKTNPVANYGPAYMPIREINYIVAANAVWAPVYGKQIFFLSAVTIFDLFFTMGGGLVMSEYYPEQTILRNGQKSRASYNQTTQRLEGGAAVSDSDSYGEAGRPDVESATTPFINLGIGQKVHFLGNFHLKMEFRNMLLVGTPAGFENLFAFWGGVGMRF